MALAAWDAYAERLPAVPDGWDVALVAVFVFPATFLIAWLLLPLAGERHLLGAALVTGALAALLDLQSGRTGSSSREGRRLLPSSGSGSCRCSRRSAGSCSSRRSSRFDVASVYRGPTKVVVEEQPGLFERIAVAFALPGDDGAGRLGPPDVIFFALFLAAAARYGLRLRATWLGMAGALSATLLLTYALDLNGLPALPAISLGFVVPNADLLWRSLRSRGAARAAPLR